MPTETQDIESTLEKLVEAGKRMTPRDYREQTINYVIAETKHVTPEDRKMIEQAYDMSHGPIDTSDIEEVEP